MSNLSYKLNGGRVSLTRKLLAIEKEAIKKNNHKITALNAIILAELMGKKRFQKMPERIINYINEAYDEILSYNNTVLYSTSSIVSGHTVSNFNKIIGVNILQAKNKIHKNLIKTMLMGGASVQSYWYKQKQQHKEIYVKAIKEGISLGQTTEDIVSKLRGTVALNHTDGKLNIIKNKTRVLVRTSLTNTENFTKLNLFNDNKDVIKGFQWVATFDERTSYICASLDGNQWDLNYVPLTGATFQGYAPHPNCRSGVIAITKSYKELGLDNKSKINQSTRASMDGQVSDKLNYTDWFKSKSKTFQEAKLGKRRYDIYTNNKLSYNDLVNASGSTKTIEQLEKQYK